MRVIEELGKHSRSRSSALFSTSVVAFRSAKSIAILPSPGQLLQFALRTGAELEQTGVLQCSSPLIGTGADWSGAPANWSTHRLEQRGGQEGRTPSLRCCSPPQSSWAMPKPIGQGQEPRTRAACVWYRAAPRQRSPLPSCTRVESP